MTKETELHYPFTAKHDNCAACDKEYEPPPALPPLEQPSQNQVNEETDPSLSTVVVDKDNSLDAAEDRPYRWVITPHPYSSRDFDFYVTDDDRQAERAWLYLFESAHPGDELAATMKFDGRVPHVPITQAGSRPQTQHVPDQGSVQHDSESSPQPGSPTCSKCGHAANDKRRRGSDEFNSFCILGCGCACEFQLPKGEQPLEPEGFRNRVLNRNDLILEDYYYLEKRLRAGTARCANCNAVIPDDATFAVCAQCWNTRTSSAQSVWGEAICIANDHKRLPLEEFHHKYGTNSLVAVLESAKASFAAAPSAENAKKVQQAVVDWLIDYNKGEVAVLAMCSSNLTDRIAAALTAPSQHSDAEVQALIDDVDDADGKRIYKSLRAVSNLLLTFPPTVPLHAELEDKQEKNLV